MLDEIKETLKIASEQPKQYDETRQQWIDTSSQKVDDVVTGGLQKINMPGAEFIGDRARNITGFAQDMTIPESWELPLLAGGAAVAAAEPTPFGEALVGLKYGTGVTSRAYRAGKKVLKKPIAVGTVMAANIVDDVFSRTNSLFNRNSPNWRLATPDGADLAQQSAQPMRMTGGGSGSTFGHSILNKTNRGLYKQLKTQDPKLIDQAENIIKELDLFKTSEGSSQQFTKWNPNRPTTGFKGTRTVPYINSDGVASEVAFRWSVSNNTYVPYDLVRRQNTILKRLRWNVNRSPKAKWYADKVYKSAKGDNEVLRKLLTELREENPQRYFDIMGDTRNYAENKGFIFVEHIHAQNSPYWKYVSKGQFKPRDTSNLMIVKNENFGKLKTSIEKHIYDNKDFVFPEGKRLILDYDKTRDVLVLKQLQDNGRLNRIGDISPITNPRNWKRALDAALEGHTIRTGKVGEIQQVIQGDPDIDRNVDLQHGISDWNKPKE